MTTWLEEKGFGFIAPDDSNLGDLFVHVSELRDARANGLERGDRVRFDVKYNREKGKNLAVNVIVEKSGASGTRKRNRDSRARGGHRGKRGRSRSRDSRAVGLLSRVWVLNRPWRIGNGRRWMRTMTFAESMGQLPCNGVMSAINLPKSKPMPVRQRAACFMAQPPVPPDGMDRTSTGAVLLGHQLKRW